MKKNTSDEIRITESMAPSIDALARIRVQDCYQCGKCTAGCPVAHLMDIMPNQILRQAQLGQLERAMLSDAVWQCVSCQTCTVRCPQSVDCAGVIDALRQLAVINDLPATARRQVVLFYKAFLQNIRRNGRLHELELVGRFKTSVFARHLNIPFLFKDAALAPQMMRRGKLHLKAGKVQDRSIVDRIFDRCFQDGHASEASSKTKDKEIR